MNLPELAVRRPITVFMVYLAIIGLGGLAVTRMAIDLYPDIELPNIGVITIYPGASSQDVESSVTKEIEEAVSTISGVDEVKSISQNNISVVTASFAWGTDLDGAANDMRDALEFAKEYLPEGIEPPRLIKLSSSMAPLLVLAVTADESYDGLTHIVEKRIGDVLKQVPGVALVSPMGGTQREIRVEVDAQSLEAYGISLSQLAAVLAAENLDLPVGSLKSGWSEFTVRVPGEFGDLSELSKVVVGQSRGRLIHLDDVAQVRDAFADRVMEAQLDGRPGVIVLVQKQSGANTVEVATRVKAKLRGIVSTLPPDVEVTTVMDSSEYIRNSVRSLITAVGWGFLGVILVVLLFLRRLRSTIVIGITIPVSFLVVLAVMYALDYTINVVSLMSLAIAIGMVVDAAVVVLENVTRHVEEGERVSEASMFAPSEVGQALVASAFTTIAVFIPMIFMTGIVGVMFNQLGIIVSLTIGISLLVALTLTPALSSTFLRRTLENKTDEGRGAFFITSERFFERLESRYANLLEGVLCHRRRTILIAVGIFVGVTALGGFLKSEFYPQEDSGDVMITVELAPGTRLERTLEVLDEISGIIEREVPEREHYFVRAGQSESGFSMMMGMKEGSNVGTIGAQLVPKSERNRSSFEIANLLRERINELPGILSLKVSSGNPMQAAMLGGDSPVSVYIQGDDLDVIDATAYRVRDVVMGVDGTVDVRVERGLPQPELQVVIDREKAASLGVNTAIVAGALRGQVRGIDATEFSEGGEEWDVVLRVLEGDRDSVDDILALPIETLTGQTVRLSSVADVVPGTGPTTITRLDQQRIAKVQADIYGRKLSDVTPEVRAGIAALDIPEGVRVSFGGDIEEQRESFRDLTLLLVLAIALVYIVMAAQFQSFRGPLVIMFSIPFAFVGVVLAFLVTGTTLNMISFLGMVMLMGIVVNNAIVLVDYTNILRKRGLGVREAIIASGRRRLRPVLMTALTTMCGMLPLALSRSEGAESWNPLGVSMVGGLLVATVVTLVLVPTIYSVFESRSPRGEGISA